MNERTEPKLLIQTMCVSRCEDPPAKALEVGMLDHRFHQPLAQTAATVLRKDKDVTDVSERGEIANYSTKTDLSVVVIDPKTDGILDSSTRLLGCTPRCPVGLILEKSL